MVLSRFDRCDINEVGLIRAGSADAGRCPQIDAKRGDDNRYRRISRGEISIKSDSRVCRIDDHRIRQARHGFHAATVAFRLFPPDVFWILDRDQVVDEDHKTRTGALFEPRYRRRLMQVMMRDQ